VILSSIGASQFIDEYIHVPILSQIIFTFGVILVSFLMLVVFTTYPTIFSSEEYFKRLGYKRAVIEHENLTRGLIIVIPLSIVVMIYTSTITASDIFAIRYTQTIQYTVILTLLTPLIKMGFQIIRKDFRYQFAKGCFIVAAREHDEVRKMHYINSGLTSYNMYLQRILKLQFRDVKVTSFLLSQFSKEQTDTFLEDMVAILNNSRLEAIKYLSSSFKFGEGDQFLIKQSIANKLKDWIAFSIAAISGIIGIFQVIFLFTK
jgi:hypothetical protein